MRDWLVLLPPRRMVRLILSAFPYQKMHVYDSTILSKGQIQMGVKMLADGQC